MPHYEQKTVNIAGKEQGGMLPKEKQKTGKPWMPGMISVVLIVQQACINPAFKGGDLNKRDMIIG